MSSSSADEVSGWLMQHPAPAHRRDIPEWQARVRSKLGTDALEALIELLTNGNLEEQYQAMAAARSLGAEVSAEGYDPNLTWVVKLPGWDHARQITPQQQLEPWRPNLRADLNAEDDDGLNRTLLEDAQDPDRVRPGAVLTAGTPTAWAWVRIVAVNDDGQVQFQPMPTSELGPRGGDDG
jgi:hypothetical protein